MKVHFSHLCEKAFLSQNGNLNLIGIFETVTAQQFPVVFPQVSLVTSIQSNPGEHQVIMKIKKVADDSEVTKPITINLNIEAPEDAPTDTEHTLRLMGDINNLRFEEEGDYIIEIHGDGELCHTLPFKVVKASKPIPEGR